MIEDLLRSSCSKDDDLKNLLTSLSDREIEVMILFAFGLSRKEAAIKLGISPRTIDSYTERIKQKLGLNESRKLAQQAINLKECLVVLYKNGILPDESSPPTNKKV